MRARFLLFPGLFLTSCVSYQHVTLSSDQPVEENTSRYFVEEDQIRVTFDFDGFDFPVVSRIYNLSDSVLFVDLGASSFTVNGQVVANAKNSKVVRYSSNTDSYTIGEWEYYDTEGKAVVPPDKDFIAIPPMGNAQLTNYPFKASYDPQKRISYTEMDTIIIGSIARRSKRYDFSKESRVLGANYFISFNRDWKNAKIIGATFKEESLYNSTSSPVILETPAAQRYKVYKRHRPLAGVVLIGLLGFGIYGLATYDGDVE